MNADQWRRATAEAIGTFFLVLIGPGAAMSGGLGTVGIALSFAFVITGMIYAVGDLSGAHLNPAVTVAFWSIRRFPGRDVGPYIVAQCAGAVGASVLLRGVLGPVGHLGATLPAIAIGRACAIEVALSFALMFVIMGVAAHQHVAAIAIGFTVGFCALVGGPLTGASMNPARSFGPALVGGEWRGHWLYWVAPIVGMLAAARMYEALRPVGAPRASRAGEIVGVEGVVPR